MGIAAVSRLTPVRDLGHKGEVLAVEWACTSQRQARKKADTVVRHVQDDSREQINVGNLPRRFLAGEY
jgi:hypothetical protein